MIERNGYVIIFLDNKIKEGNNARVVFLDSDEQAIKYFVECDDKLETMLVYKNGEALSPYMCRRAVEIHKRKVKIWSSYDPFVKNRRV